MIGTVEDEAIGAAIRTFETGWNSHNMETMFQAFTPDAEWVNVVGMWWRGLPDVKHAHRAYHETTFKDHSYRIEDVSIRRVTPDAAVAIVRWKKDSFVDPSGNHRPEGRDLMS